MHCAAHIPVLTHSILTFLRVHDNTPACLSWPRLDVVDGRSDRVDEEFVRFYALRIMSHHAPNVIRPCRTVHAHSSTQLQAKWARTRCRKVQWISSWWMGSRSAVQEAPKRIAAYSKHESHRPFAAQSREIVAALITYVQVR